MPSAFEDVARRVVRELGHKGQFIPVNSLRNAARFQPYALVRRKPSSSWFWRPPYMCVDLDILDILDPQDPKPEVKRSSSFHLHDSVDGKMQGNVELGGPGQGRLAGGAAVSDSSSASIDVCTLTVETSTWETLQERHLRQPEHTLLRLLRTRGDNVYVVTEVLQTQKDMEVTRTRKREGSGQFTLPWVECLQGEGHGHVSQKTSVTVPAGSVLAFQVMQLVIDSDSKWKVLFFPDKKQQTFQKPSADGVGDEGTLVTKDFSGLKKEVDTHARSLESMSSRLRQKLLKNLVVLLQDPAAQQALEEALEQGLCCGQVGSLEGPAGNVLECLVLPSQVLVKELASPVFYLLGALNGMSEREHLLMVKALEFRVLAGQLGLVAWVLEQSSPWQEIRDLSLPQEFLGSHWGEDAPAWVLLEECGLELQVGAPQVRWEPEAQGCTCALYAALALLWRLGAEAC
ncbi:gasdermin-D [Rhynchocyon petersi]